MIVCGSSKSREESFVSLWINKTSNEPSGKKHPTCLSVAVTKVQEIIEFVAVCVILVGFFWFLGVAYEFLSVRVLKNEENVF